MMSEKTIIERPRLAWLFVALVGLSGLAVFYGGTPAGASNDAEAVHALRQGGEIRPLAELLARPELAGMRVLEAELEREYGSMVYELELMDPDGRVYERYYDAATGEPLRYRGD
jgi:uncharacterized membrane protein YkoI